MRTTHTPTRPYFAVDASSFVRGSGRQIDWANVGEQYRTTPGQIVEVGAGGAAAAATTVPVLALARDLPSGTTLDFGGAKFARTTAAASAGATSITVAALVTALDAGDQATVAGTGYKFLQAGTVVGSLLGNGKVSPRVETTNPATGILETNANEDPKSPDSLSGYGVLIGGNVYENLLPEASGVPKVLATAVKTELNAAGTGFAFEQYADSRTA